MMTSFKKKSYCFFVKVKLVARQLNLRHWLNIKYWIFCFYKERKYKLRIHPDATVKIKGKLLVGQRISIGQFSKILVAENSTLIINDDVWINDNCHIETCSGQAIKIGSKTTLQSRCQIRGDITIGENVLFAPNAFVSSGTHLYSYIPSLSIREQDQRYQENHGGIYSKPIIIGEDCWFGINVVILPGITIGNNCVIGANSVVTKNINTGLVSAGVPAKIIKNRFKET